MRLDSSGGIRGRVAGCGFATAGLRLRGDEGGSFGGGQGPDRELDSSLEIWYLSGARDETMAGERKSSRQIGRTNTAAVSGEEGTGRGNWRWEVGVGIRTQYCSMRLGGGRWWKGQRT